jgi:hypothetical protein
LVLDSILERFAHSLIRSYMYMESNLLQGLSLRVSD